MNHVRLRFHYANDFIGRAVSTVQRVLGVPHPELCHVTLHLNNGTSIDRTFGQTLFGTENTNNGIDILVETDLSDHEIEYLAFAILCVQGEGYGDCATYVSRIIALPYTVSEVRYPGKLFTLLQDGYRGKLKEVLKREDSDGRR